MPRAEACMTLPAAARELGYKDPRTVRRLLIELIGIVPPALGRGKAPLVQRRHVEILKSRLCGKQEFQPHI